MPGPGRAAIGEAQAARDRRLVLLHAFGSVVTLTFEEALRMQGAVDDESCVASHEVGTRRLRFAGDDRRAEDEIGDDGGLALVIEGQDVGRVISRCRQLVLRRDN